MHKTSTDTIKDEKPKEPTEKEKEDKKQEEGDKVWINPKKGETQIVFSKDPKSGMTIIPNHLVFRYAPLMSNGYCHFEVKNMTELKYAFKVKVPKNGLFICHPSAGYLAPGKGAFVRVTLRSLNVTPSPAEQSEKKASHVAIFIKQIDEIPPTPDIPKKPDAPKGPAQPAQKKDPEAKTAALKKELEERKMTMETTFLTTYKKNTHPEFVHYFYCTFRPEQGTPDGDDGQ